MQSRLLFRKRAVFCIWANYGALPRSRQTARERVVMAHSLAVGRAMVNCCAYLLPVVEDGTALSAALPARPGQSPLPIMPLPIMP